MGRPRVLLFILACALLALARLATSSVVKVNGEDVVYVELDEDEEFEPHLLLEDERPRASDEEVQHERRTLTQEQIEARERATQKAIHETINDDDDEAEESEDDDDNQHKPVRSSVPLDDHAAVLERIEYEKSRPLGRDQRHFAPRTVLPHLSDLEPFLEVTDETFREYSNTTLWIIPDDSGVLGHTWRPCVFEALRRHGYRLEYVEGEEYRERLEKADVLPPLVMSSFPNVNNMVAERRLKDIKSPYVFDNQGRVVPVKLNHLCGRCNYILFKEYLREEYNRNEVRRAGLNEFHPRTFLLPDELDQFREYAASEAIDEKNQRWIFKPLNQNGGKGHRILDAKQLIEHAEKMDLSTLTAADEEHRIAQRIVHPPMLVYNRKVDIRAWGLTTSLDPTYLWSYGNSYVYLNPIHYNQTSYSKDNYVANINIFEAAKRRNYDDARRPRDQRYMWTEQELRRWMDENYIDHDSIFDRMHDAMAASLLVGSAKIASFFDTNKRMWNHTFELNGWDFVIDESGNPWMLEINFAPNDMSNHGGFHHELICALQHDMYRLVAPNPRVYSYGDPWRRTEDDYDALLAWVREASGLGDSLRWCTQDESHRRVLRQEVDPQRTSQSSPDFSLDYPAQGYLVKDFESVDQFECLTRQDLEVILDIEEQLVRRGGFVLSSFPFKDPFRMARLFPTHRNLLVARWFELSRTLRRKRTGSSVGGPLPVFNPESFAPESEESVYRPVKYRRPEKALEPHGA